MLLLSVRLQRARTRWTCDDRKCRHIEEKSVFNDTGNGIQLARKRLCIRNAAKRCINDVVAAVRREVSVTGLP